MKWSILLMLLPVLAQAQNVSINSDGSKADANAMLDIRSANKGLLIPRITSQSRERIPNTQGLLVYDINTNSFWYNTGRKWINMIEPQLTVGPSGFWDLTGNAGTIDGTNFLGTTDNVPLTIRVNNQQSGRIDQNLGNTSWGYRSAFNMSTGANNTAVGAGAMFVNTTGFNNTAVGADALQSNTTGFHNAAFGRFALNENSTGFNNTAIGTSSMLFSTTGSNNTAVGANALYVNRAGNYNVVMGVFAMQGNFSGSSNTAIGYSAMHHNWYGNENTAIGYEALPANEQGNENVAVGFQSLYSNTESRNTATGYRSLRNNTTGMGLTAFGYEALYSSNGYENTAVGNSAARNNLGNSNTAIGHWALMGSGIGSLNTSSGSWSLNSNSDGWGNVANGSDALRANTLGIWNTSIGGGTMLFNGASNYNTAVGTTALISNTGAQNTAVGVGALGNNGGGSNNTALGFGTNVTSGSLVNATVIGANAVVDASNKVRIGNSAVTVIEGQVPFTYPSDGRYKFEVQEDVKGLDFIMQLRPVTYRFDTKKFDEQLMNMQEVKADYGVWTMPAIANPEMDQAYAKASSIRRTGFIAQEVEQAAKKTGYNFSGVVAPNKEQQHYSLSYDAFVVPLVKAIQEQQQIISDQNKKIEALQEEIKEIKRMILKTNN